ncbi:hypothetical protein ACG02S_19810, partial [Roseateles sp. DC23W]
AEMGGHDAETVGHDEPKWGVGHDDRNHRSRCRNRRSRWAEIRIMALTPATPDAPLVVRVESAGNFSAEVQRLAAYLWPSHPQAVTGYCLRHQWSADAKRNGDVSSVSRGLGHLSGMTQRRYGTAAQDSKAHRLKPLRIEADRPVKGTAPEVTPTDPDEPKSAS